MERRKFFKSLGLLSLAAVIPKFLLGSEKEELKDQYLFFVDPRVKPGCMTNSEWFKHIYNGVFYYDFNKCNLIRPNELKIEIIAGTSKVLGRDLQPIERNYLPDFNKLKCIEVNTNWFVNEDNFCNYLSIQRYPISTTGHEGILTC